ncbi:MAG: hypothetical protein WBO41_01290, partial [Sphingorhabdus sp.]
MAFGGEASTRTWRSLSGSNPAFLFLPLALLKRSCWVSGFSTDWIRFPFPFCFSGWLPCLTTERSHQLPSRANGKMRLIHRQAALRWIKERTKVRHLLAGNFDALAWNIATNEDGLHAVHE